MIKISNKSQHLLNNSTLFPFWALPYVRAIMSYGVYCKKENKKLVLFYLQHV